MWQCLRVRMSKLRFTIPARRLPRRPRLEYQPCREFLELRELLTASLQPIANLSVPSQLGYQLPLDGSGGTAATQTFTATSSNPDIKVSVAQGPFWTITVSHQSSGAGDVAIDHETMTFQLFADLTSATVSRITSLTNQGYYTLGFPGTTPPTPAGQYIPRITSVASSGFAAIQGGSSSPTSTASTSGIPPIATEPVQQLAYDGIYQIAMANTGQPDSTDAQFFITTGTYSASVQQAFDFNYTIFGQLVSGANTVTDLSRVAVQLGSSGEDSQPVTPVVINAATLSNNNASGVLHIDTTGAKAGETATVTVTATDPADRTTSTRSFAVTTSAYNGPASPVINFAPFASPVAASTGHEAPVTVQLQGASGYPDSAMPSALGYQILTQPAHGTISNFDATSGTFVYTPEAGYSGPDSFQYLVQATGPLTSPATTTSNPGTVSITVAALVPSPVTVTGVKDVLNARNQVTQIEIDFSAPVNRALAMRRTTYRLALAGKTGTYTGRNARVITFRKLVYNSANDSVTLTPTRPLALSRTARLVIIGIRPHGLKDGTGQLLDGNHDGKPGGNAIAYLSASGIVVV
jgi:cyclophilin family peptidyl-prolyl cis-trans isomerase